MRKAQTIRGRSTAAKKATWKGTELRRAILDEASRLFIERGMGGTSMQDIADALGITRTAVYYYFKNKEQILGSLTEHVTMSAKRLARKAAARRDVNPQEALRELVEQHARLILSQAMEFRVVERNQGSLPQKLKSVSEAARRAVLENFAEVIERGIQSGELRRVDPKIAAFALIGMCNWSAWWFRRGGRRSEDEITSILADLALHALRAEPRKGPPNASVRERIQSLREDLDRIEELLPAPRA